MSNAFSAGDRVRIKSAGWHTPYLGCTGVVRDVLASPCTMPVVVVVDYPKVGAMPHPPVICYRPTELEHLLCQQLVTIPE